jgi:hypothetical protein
VPGTKWTSFGPAPLVWLLAVSGPLLAGSTCWEPGSFDRPNVVLIMADDLGWNDVGYHGSDIETPNLPAWGC